MKTTELRQLIKESIQEYIKEIDAAGNRAALEAKMAKTQEAIDLRKKKLNMEGLDEAYHDMMDKGKMKEMTSEIKLLEKSMGKYKKALEKMDAKDTPKMEEMQDDNVDEEMLDETNLDEYTADSASELEEAKMTKAEKAKMYATATKLATKEPMNESFSRMQILAGLITENIKQADSSLGREVGNYLNDKIAKMNRPDLESKARALANQLITLMDEANK